MLNYDSYAGKYDSRYTSDMCMQENKAIYDAIIKIPNYTERKVLDIGCGTGFFLDLFYSEYEKAESNYIGIDISDEMVKCAREKYPKVKFYAEDSRNMERIIRGNDFHFDFAISFFTIPYIGVETIKSVYENISKGDFFLTVYYDKPYINPCSVYSDKKEYYENEVNPKVQECVNCMRNLFTEVYNHSLTEHKTYKIALYKK